MCIKFQPDPLNHFDFSTIHGNFEIDNSGKIYIQNYYIILHYNISHDP